MKPRQEKLGNTASVKGTMLKAHLEWADKQRPDLIRRVRARLGADYDALLAGKFLATDWIKFSQLVKIDRAIAAELGGSAEAVFRDLGRHSAAQNLAGVYKSYLADEPHRFFENSVRLHGRFQDFGHPAYEKTGERSGRLTIADYFEYSPAYCMSAVGYYEEALRSMKVPGPVHVAETSCTCAGDPACVYEAGW